MLKYYYLFIISCFVTNVSFYSGCIQLPDNSYILKHLPVVETERCILRPLGIADAPEIFAFTSDPEVAALTAMFKLHKTVEETVAYVQALMAESEQGREFYWVVVQKGTQKVMGLVCFYGYVYQHARVNIGYTIARPFWKQGYATEIAAAMIKFSFDTLGCYRIQATVHPANKASIRVLEKCGMQYEGLLRCFYLSNGKRSDRVMYSIILENLK